MSVNPVTAYFKLKNAKRKARLANVMAKPAAMNFLEFNFEPDFRDEVRPDPWELQSLRLTLNCMRHKPRLSEEDDD